MKENFATRVSLPVQYQPLVYITKAKIRMNKLVKHMERNIRLSDDPDYVETTKFRLVQLRVIRADMREVEWIFKGIAEI